MTWLGTLLGRKPSKSLASQNRSEQTIHSRDLQANPAYAALLERFLSAREAKEGAPDYWASALGSSSHLVIARMRSSGLLEPAPLEQIVETSHTAADLKGMLLSRGLKVSGKKAEQAARLVANDSEAMLRLVGNSTYLKCTDLAREFVAGWRAKDQAAREQAVISVMEFLRARSFLEAVTVADDYRSCKFKVPTQPLENSIAIPPKPRSRGERAEDLAHAFQMRPKMLDELNSEQWEGLRLNYGLWQLLGHTLTERCLPGFAGIGAMDGETVTRMMHFFIRHQEDLSRWRRLGVKRATFSCCNSGSCDACMALDQKIFSLKGLPELPYPRCTCALGCRCYADPDLGF